MKNRGTYRVKEIVRQRGNIKNRVIDSVKENDIKIIGSREKSEEEFKC